MSSLDDYPALFREAYVALHGGGPDDAPTDSGRRPDESLEEYLARSRSEALGRVRGRLESATPTQALRDAHDLLSRLLALAVEADAALARQVEAYSCGNFEGSIAHSDRLAEIVAESARLDRALIAALRALPPELAELAGIQLPEDQ
ncbi:MAG: hypothetical protein WD379_03015 [Dehalococcoidia bacterium]